VVGVDEDVRNRRRYSRLGTDRRGDQASGRLAGRDQSGERTLKDHGKLVEAVHQGDDVGDQVHFQGVQEDSFSGEGASVGTR
jgi:hypothetical protein